MGEFLEEEDLAVELVGLGRADFDMLSKSSNVPTNLLSSTARFYMVKLLKKELGYCKIKAYKLW